MSEQTNETTCPHCGGPGCEVCSWTGTVSVDPSRRRQRAPGDGSAAVPSEPRRWTLSGEDYGVPFGCVVTRGPGLLASEEVTVEEVGPVSEAEVEAGARAIEKQRGEYDARRSERSQDLFGHPGAAVYSSVPPITDADISRAVLSAAREVKSDGD